MSREHSETAGRVDCGPEGCELDWLTSARLEVDDDPAAFQKLATDAGWGDGLPLIPPTEARRRGRPHPCVVGAAGGAGSPGLNPLRFNPGGFLGGAGVVRRRPGAPRAVDP